MVDNLSNGSPAACTQNISQTEIIVAIYRLVWLSSAGWASHQVCRPANLDKTKIDEHSTLFNQWKNSVISDPCFWPIKSQYNEVNYLYLDHWSRSLTTLWGKAVLSVTNLCCRRFLNKIGNFPELFGGSRLKTKNFALNIHKNAYIYIETRVRGYETCHCTCLSFPKNDLKLVIPFREKL